MEDPRSPTPQERDKVVEFLDTQLRPNVSWSIAEEYPLAFSKDKIKNSKIITENSLPIAHAHMETLLIKTPLGLFKVAAIGSVVTHPQFRNKGLSQKILNQCLKEAKDQLCDFAILWTDLFDFYRKLDFELAGHEYSLKIPLSWKNKPLPENFRFLNSIKVKASEILKIYNTHRTGTLRTAKDIENFLKIPNTSLFTAWDKKTNQLLAYAVEGKGADLTNYIHEWGGKVSAFIPLLQFAQSHYSQSLTLIAPRHSENLIRQMSHNGADLHKGYLGMIRILHPQNIFFKMQRYARQLGYTDVICTCIEDKFVLGYKNDLVGISSLRSLTQILFGPLKLEEAVRIKPQTKEVLEKILPLPMWVWGWDSI
ncbi:MAG: GNAT family N-acetyltransferase [Bdellovibrio sp.]|nr:MAG: GNAT family N-acetyltransferase [Bdellovibrio sp.]